jgi:hypothetical protein
LLRQQQEQRKMALQLPEEALVPESELLLEAALVPD